MVPCAHEYDSFSICNRFRTDLDYCAKDHDEIRILD